MRDIDAEVRTFSEWNTSGFVYICVLLFSLCYLGPSEVEELAKKLMEVKVAASVNSEIDELFNLGEGTLVETPTLQRAVSDM